jgi:ectoine hydroxylase-related dioxygenase (phytanoyl-CoA dioxygenase family)
MPERVLSDEQLLAFQCDGYILARSLFDADEMAILSSTARQDAALSAESYGRKDADGNVTRLALWNDPPDNLYGLFARSSRLVGAAEQLLEGEVYHYHSKLMLKEPLVGGSWEWHQDYGYWYHNGCLWPLLVSCLIAIDQATRSNGCLQVIQGSHHLGRVEHAKRGEQTGADMERVQAALERLPLVYIEANPGDVLFFHCNLLHRSDVNRSPDPRWSLICCYNAARNNPYKESRHPCYKPLQRVPDSAIKAFGQKLPANDANQRE